MNIRSEATRALLSYYFSHENESLYTNELVRKLKLDKRNLIKKLKEFEQLGLLKCEHRGNLKLYSINKKFTLYKEYKNIIMKTAGVEQQLRNVLANIIGIKAAFIFGSYAKNAIDESSDIDVMVIGDHSSLEAQTAVTKVQKILDREINLINIGSKEFDSKKNDPFISEVMKQKRITLI